jgi:hypothetical protein
MESFIQKDEETEDDIKLAEVPRALDTSEFSSKSSKKVKKKRHHSY